MEMKYKSNHLLDIPSNKLDTGDLVFTFNGDGDVWHDAVFDNQHYSKYRHVGMIVNNPDFDDIKLYGLYVLEIKELFSGCKGTPVFTPYNDFIDGVTRLDARCWKNNRKEISNIFKKTYNNCLSKNSFKCGFLGKCLHVCGFDCCKEHYSDKFFWPTELIVFMLKEMKLFFPKKHESLFTPHDLSSVCDNTINKNLESLIRII
tara:strand:- start:2201 stop:2809 length:609 start_codon:yes stop_codon:yes gene_type:complete